MLTATFARFVRPAVLLAVTLGLSLPAHAVYTSTLTASAGGSYGSGNTGVGSDQLSNVPMAPNSSTGLHGLVNASGIDGFANITTQGIASNNITNATGSFGMHGSLNAFTNVNTNTNSAYNYYVNGFGRLNLHDYLVIHPTAAYPANTQVTVTFSIEVFFAGSRATNPGVVTNPNSDYAEYFAYVGAGGSSTVAGYFSPDPGNPPTSFYMDSNANKTYDYTNNYGSASLGIFASPSHHVDYTITVKVGQIFDFALDAQAQAYANIAAWGSPLAGQGALADCLLGVAFGATASPVISSAGFDSFTTLSTNNDLAITSGLFGQFPDGSNANAKNAYIAGGLQVPEPASLALLSLAGLLLIRRRKSA